MINNFNNSNFRKILVTGGCGFLGSHITELLLKKGLKLVVLDDLSTGNISNIELSHPNLQFVEGSVLDADLVKQISQDCDLIIHLASTVGMKLVYDKPEQSYAVSKEGTENIFLTPFRIPVVLFSSSAVYGHNNSNRISEVQSISEQDALEYDGGTPGYAVGKWELENIGKRQMGKGRKVIILRPFNIIGSRQSAAYGMVVPNFISNSLDGRPIEIYDDGEQTRSFTCVDTFSKCLYEIIHNKKAWVAPNNIINIGTDKSNSVNKLAQIVLEKSASISEIQYSAYKEIFPNKKDVRHRQPDLTRLHSLIGKVHWPTLEQIVETMIKLHKQNGVPSV